VDEYLTDDQEVDRAKQWVRENGAFLVAGVVLGLGGLFGWQQWQNAGLEHAGEASVVWEQMQTAVAGDRFNEAEETLAILAADYSDTPYYDQARLAMAKLYMERNEPEAAATQLRDLSGSAGDRQVARIAELRLAQVLLYQQQPEEALAILGEGDEGAFAGLYQELRGDAFLALGQAAEARDAYLAALATAADGVINRDYVSLKLEAVSSTLTTDAADAAALPDEASETEAAQPAESGEGS
jgi:predicted negative regulator of RcsB-dependent stress response